MEENSLVLVGLARFPRGRDRKRGGRKKSSNRLTTTIWLSRAAFMNVPPHAPPDKTMIGFFCHQEVTPMPQKRT